MSDKSVKEWVEINCDRDRLPIRTWQQDDVQERRFIWNHKGLRKEIPTEVLEDAIELYSAWGLQQRRPWIQKPKDIGFILWEQTVVLPENAPVSATGSRDPEKLHKES